MKTTLLAIILCCIFSFSAYTQNNKTISGKVTDVQGEALPGVNVLIKGTNRGTATDIDGKYSLKVPTGATLVFSFIAMKPKELEVDGMIQVKDLELYSTGSHEQKDVVRKWKKVIRKLSLKAIGILKDDN
ncbi:carboxypeptidase-like regulatory domain-containing protein [Microscilla marina]|uniref:Putative outer membrane protein, probably involved in nutrient binding n=1 Tax=Microscilla marina ATCC 23134 TaxID=313606 RepID=A1ZFG4_MICM2|nr:carboxypeptidase-like regulatory domain-containing protein [Microscilla marina]EAY30738.1 putative outer membrane protein, probably involved in nutrient binding [Microscilla marina ATCC 23134]